MSNAEFTINVFVDKTVERTLAGDLIVDLQNMFLQKMAYGLQSAAGGKVISTKLLTSAATKILEALNIIRVGSPTRKERKKSLWMEVEIRIDPTSHNNVRSIIGCSASVYTYDADVLGSKIVGVLNSVPAAIIFLKKLRVLIEKIFAQGLVQFIKLLPFDIGGELVYKIKKYWLTSPLGIVIVRRESISNLSLSDKRFEQFAFRFSKMIIVSVNEKDDLIEMLLFGASKSDSPLYISYPIRKAGSYKLYDVVRA
jgi:hypothetical protein